jgi:enamine deaminase RidA (YjgF/YER057c/UK114 family)
LVDYRRNVSSGSPYEPIIGFSRAVRVGQHVQLGGTAPIWPDGSCDPDPAAQMRRCLEIMETALAQCGASFSDVVRTRTFFTSVGDWEAIGRVHGEVFGDIRPASTMVIVSGFLDPRWKVELEADAILPPSAI